MFDLSRFSLSDTFEVSAAVPDVAQGAATLRDAAGRLVRYFAEHAVNKESGERSLALVQCFLGCPFDQLPADLQTVAVTASADVTPQPRQQCLTLLAAAGDGPPMSDARLVRHASTVVVPSAAANVLAPWTGLHHDDPRRESPRKVGPSYAVGYIAGFEHSGVLTGWADMAVGYGISGCLWVTARFGPDRLVTLGLYSKAPIPGRTANAFAAVAIGLKLALLEHVALAVPDIGSEPTGPRTARGAADKATLLQAQNETLRELLRVRHEIAVDESGQLEQALELAESRSLELTASQTALAGSEARGSAIVRAALDAVVVMDASGRIVEWNPAAEAIFGYTRDECLGQVLSNLIVPEDLRHRHTRGLQRYLATGEGPLLGNRVETAGLRRDGTTFPVELTIAAVAGGDGPPMFTGFIRDVTERREQQAALLSSRESFAHIARSLQRSLLPAAMPQVPGVELGAVFHPSRAGSDVGGDFYDVFSTGRTDLILSLGDVCGKGAEAAAITAIARYTIRAVAPDVRHPASILRRVNTVLQDHDIGERFCSVVTARAIPIVRGLRLSVCCAGHERPVIVRSDRRVDRVGVAGQLLGLFPDVRLLEETVQLGHGDTFVLFTDGVTEARREGEQFGEQRLASALLDVHEAPVIEMVNHLLEEVLAFGGDKPRDDIAILAARAVSG